MQFTQLVFICAVNITASKQSYHMTCFYHRKPLVTNLPDTANYGTQRL